MIHAARGTRDGSDSCFPPNSPGRPDTYFASLAVARRDGCTRVAMILGVSVPKLKALLEQNTLRIDACYDRRNACCLYEVSSLGGTL